MCRVALSGHGLGIFCKREVSVLEVVTNGTASASAAAAAAGGMTALVVADCCWWLPVCPSSTGSGCGVDGASIVPSSFTPSSILYLVRKDTVFSHVSPRTTAPYQILEFRPT